MEVERIPAFLKQELVLKSKVKMPLVNLIMCSAVFANLAKVFGSVPQVTEASGEVLYRFTSRGHGGGPTALKDGSGFISTVTSKGEGIVGQGAFVPATWAGSVSKTMVSFDPMTLAIAIALAEVNKS